MVRSAPSRADQQLIDALAEQGLRCSRYQLERWRGHGLLEPVRVVHPGGGGSFVEHPPETFERVEILAACTARGTAWEWLAQVLLEHGYELPDAVVRASLCWRVGAERRQLDRLLQRIQTELDELEDPDELDAAERVVALLRGHRHERLFFRLNKPIIDQRYPGLRQRERYDLLRTVMTWGLVEQLGYELEAGEKAAAQGWQVEEDAREFYRQAGVEPPRARTEDLLATAQTASMAEYSAILPTSIALGGRDVQVGQVSIPLLVTLTKVRLAWIGRADVALTGQNLQRLRRAAVPQDC